MYKSCMGNPSQFMSLPVKSDVRGRQKRILFFSPPDSSELIYLALARFTKSPKSLWKKDFLIWQSPETPSSYIKMLEVYMTSSQNRTPPVANIFWMVLEMDVRQVINLGLTSSLFSRILTRKTIFSSESSTELIKCSMVRRFPSLEVRFLGKDSYLLLWLHNMIFSESQKHLLILISI